MDLKKLLDTTSHMPRAGAIRRLYVLADKENLHVIGECKDCKFGRGPWTIYMDSEGLICAKPKPHPFRDFTVPIDFGCIQFKAKNA